MVGEGPPWPRPGSAQTISPVLALIPVCLSNQVPGPSGAQLGRTRMAAPRASADYVEPFCWD